MMTPELHHRHLQSLYYCSSVTYHTSQFQTTSPPPKANAACLLATGADGPYAAQQTEVWMIVSAAVGKQERGSLLAVRRETAVGRPSCNVLRKVAAIANQTFFRFRRPSPPEHPCGV
jgi:hypothetical protein